MKKSILLTLCILIVTLCPAISVSQIVYNSDGLNIGGSTNTSSLGIKINKLSGVYWNCKTTNFFQLDLAPASPRIAGTYDRIVFYNTKKSIFNSIEVANVYNSSDARAKTNICTLSKTKDSLLQLRPVSYNWLESASITSESNDSTTYIANGSDRTKKQYGFLAQEVEEVFPEVVFTDEGGAKFINYIALIPILVETLQEQQRLIDEQQEAIQELYTILETNNSISKKLNRNNIVSISPNPTTGETTIAIALESASENLKLIFTNLSGVQVHILPITPNETIITTDLSFLKSGMYLVSLVEDNNILDSKQLVISK